MSIDWNLWHKRFSIFFLKQIASDLFPMTESSAVVPSIDRSKSNDFCRSTQNRCDVVSIEGSGDFGVNWNIFSEHIKNNRGSADPWALRDVERVSINYSLSNKHQLDEVVWIPTENMLILSAKLVQTPDVHQTGAWLTGIFNLVYQRQLNM